MKSRFTLLSALVLLSISGLTGQTAYYDAIYIRKNCIDVGPPPSFKNKNELYGALKDYYPGVTLTDPVIQQNPFFKDLVPLGGIPNVGGGAFLSSAISNLGDLNVTSLADGAGQFLMERTREELNVAFFQRFKEAMNHYPELKYLFPKTTDFIGGLASYKVSEVLEKLRDNFLEDLNAITEHFLEFAEKDRTVCLATDTQCQGRMDRYQRFFNSDAGLVMRMSVDFADGVRSGKNMRELVERLGNNPYSDKFSTGELRNAYLFAAIMSNSLLSKDTTRIWIKYSEMKALVDDAELARIYLGLIYQQILNAKIVSIAGKSVATIFKPLADNISTFKPYVEGIITEADKLNNIKLSKPSFNDYYKFSKGAIKTIHAIGDLSKFYTADPDILKKIHFNEFLDLANVTTDLVYNVDQKKYGLAVNNTLDLISKTITLTSPNRSRKELTYMDSIRKYTDFIGKVAGLTDAKEVKQAIAQIALPVGSAALKKNTRFSISLNSYVAPFAGGEFYKDNKTLAVGLYAPIGFGFNWGIWKQKKYFDGPQVTKGTKANPSSFSLFVSLIDIGAVVAYRFEDSKTSVSESVKIRLGDIFSPGLNFYYGIPRVPLSIGTGINWMPSLAKFYADKAPDLRPNGFRVFGTLAVDIPIIHFYNKTTIGQKRLTKLESKGHN